VRGDAPINFVTSDAGATTVSLRLGNSAVQIVEVARTASGWIVWSIHAFAAAADGALTHSAPAVDISLEMGFGV